MAWVASDNTCGFREECRLFARLAYVSIDEVESLSDEINAAIFVGSCREMPSLLERVARLRRKRPDCAILVTGTHFDAEAANVNLPRRERMTLLPCRFLWTSFAHAYGERWALFG